VAEAITPQATMAVANILRRIRTLQHEGRVLEEGTSQRGSSGRAEFDLTGCIAKRTTGA
jgi:hypothetical protein